MVTAPSTPQYYACSCILAFVACSVFLRMSLELKVMLLTVALVAYLVLFNISPCWQWDCCDQGLANVTKTNGTLRWGPRCSPAASPLVLMSFQTAGQLRRGPSGLDTLWGGTHGGTAPERWSARSEQKSVARWQVLWGTPLVPRRPPGGGWGAASALVQAPSLSRILDVQSSGKSSCLSPVAWEGWCVCAFGGSLPWGRWGEGRSCP